MQNLILFLPLAVPNFFYLSPNFYLFQSRMCMALCILLPAKKKQLQIHNYNLKLEQNFFASSSACRVAWREVVYSLGNILFSRKSSCEVEDGYCK
jgi:hypothetical protein